MRVLVTGAGGFIGGHLVKHLVCNDGHTVVGVDIKPIEQWWQPGVHNIHEADLRKPNNLIALGTFDVCYHLACNMGGRGFIDSHESACAMNAAMDMHVFDQCVRAGVKRVFYASTACVYPVGYQEQGDSVALAEHMAEPPWNPDGVYGAQKLFSEVAAAAYARDYPETQFRIGRFHGVFGPHGSWNDATEKAPAALMRKAIQSKIDGEPMEVWGDGSARRSFLYVDEAVEGMVRLMESDCDTPLNIGSDVSVTIREVAEVCQLIAGATAPIRFVDGPVGPHSRNSDNTLIRERLGWAPKTDLAAGLNALHDWMAPLMGVDDA